MKTTFYDQIKSNNRKTILLFFFFFLFILALGWVFGEMLGYGILGPIIAFIISLLMILISYYKADKIVLKISNARPVTKQEAAYLFHTVQGLAIAAGIPEPKMYLIDDSAPNAFATGRNPEHASVCFTTGLLQKLNRQELEGVIAHEISHIKNQDIKIMTITAVLVGVSVLLSDLIFRTFIFGNRRRDTGRAGMIIIVIGIVLAILTPLIATAIKMAISRKREFLADASGAMLTRYPEGLASALEKISKDHEPLEVANKATAHLYISNPLKDKQSFLNKMFATHPPIKERITALRNM